MILGVIFDFDGTLYDYDLCNTNGLNGVFNFLNINYEVNKDNVKQIYNKITKEIKVSNNCNNKFNKSIYFKILIEKLNLPIELIDDIIKIYNDEFNLSLKLFDNIIELFDILKNSKIKIGLLSNNNFKQQYDKLIRLNILQYFDCIQTSDEIGYEKPSNLMYLSIINKLKLPAENIIMIGDNYDHDIIPALDLKLIPFLKCKNNLKIIDSYFIFMDFSEIIEFINNYKLHIDELVYLSKLYGASELNVQGQGGNISVKLNDLLFIKSSGYILGNLESNSGYCCVNNVKCLQNMDYNNDNLLEIKLFGNKIPSMETFFHAFMKKYTVHLHFTLANIYLCTNNFEIFNKLSFNYEIIDYEHPGFTLASKIREKYNNNINLYLLKNHGIIITSDEIDNINSIYMELFNLLNNSRNNLYNNELDSYKINNSIYNIFNKSVVCRYISNFNIDILIKIKYCFPDLAVYLQTIKNIDDIDKLNIDKIPDVILFQNKVFILADNLTKLYCLTEIINQYQILCIDYDLLNNIDYSFIQSMKQEKYRKNIK